MPRELWEYYYTPYLRRKDSTRDTTSDITPRGKKRRPFCTKCGKKIRNWSKVVYVDGKPYHKKCIGHVCEFCGQVFKTKAGLRSHERSKHGCWRK